MLVLILCSDRQLAVCSSLQSAAAGSFFYILFLVLFWNLFHVVEKKTRRIFEAGGLSLSLPLPSALSPLCLAPLSLVLVLSVSVRRLAGLSVSPAPAPLLPLFYPPCVCVSEGVSPS